MISRTTLDFRRDFAALPQRVKQGARDAYRMFAVNPAHLSLKVKKRLLHTRICGPFG